MAKPRKPRSAERAAKMTAAQKSTQFKRLDYIYNADKYLTGGKWDEGKLRKDALRVAKSTNMRLLRLEKAGYTNAPAYQGAKNALQGKYTKDGQVSFGTVKDGKPRYASAARIMKMNVEELRRLLYAASQTQQAVTSTPSAVERVYNKGASALMELASEYGIKTNLNGMLSVYRDIAAQNAMKIFGYRAILQILGELTEGEETVTQERLDELSVQIDAVTQMLIACENVNLASLRKMLGLKSAPPKKNSRFKKAF